MYKFILLGVTLGFGAAFPFSKTEQSDQSDQLEKPDLPDQPNQLEADSVRAVPK